jgi:hypothetical protein
MPLIKNTKFKMDLNPGIWVKLCKVGKNVMCKTVILPFYETPIYGGPFGCIKKDVGDAKKRRARRSIL